MPYEKLKINEVLKNRSWLELKGFQNLEHQNKRGLPERKFIHTSGAEIVFDGDTRELLKDDSIRGTFNYINPLPISDVTGVSSAVEFMVKGTGHMVVDWLPSKYFGNSRGGNK